MPFLQLWEHCDIQSDADQTLIYELLDQIFFNIHSNCLPLAFIRRNSDVYHGADLLKETRFFKGAISSRIQVKTALYWSTEATTGKSPIVRLRWSISISHIWYDEDSFGGYHYSLPKIMVGKTLASICMNFQLELLSWSPLQWKVSWIYNTRPQSVQLQILFVEGKSKARRHCGKDCHLIWHDP